MSEVILNTYRNLSYFFVKKYTLSLNCPIITIFFLVCSEVIFETLCTRLPYSNCWCSIDGWQWRLGLQLRHSLQVTFELDNLIILVTLTRLSPQKN